MLLKEGQYIQYPDNIDDLSLYQDEKTIVLILSNLINNALKYSPEHSVITLMVQQNNETTTIQVKDNGIGIPIKDQKSIFERYFRAENALTNQGTGIGLNIIKSHLESLGGTIKFRSIFNEGSTFIVELPIINKKWNEHAKKSIIQRKANSEQYACAEGI